MALPLSYHWRNLFVRKTTTILTVLVIACVVGTFAWMRGFSDALANSLAIASDERKVIVLKRGSTAESNSALLPEEYNRLTQLSDIARSAAGQPLLSPEMMVQVSLPRLRDGGKTSANVAVRGVTPIAFEVHRSVRPPERMFSTGAPEVLVGRQAAEQFGGLKIGDTLRLGSSESREYKVVGYLNAGGGPFESEIWGYLPSLQNAYARTLYSSAALRLRDGADAKAVIDQVQGPTIQLMAQTEGEYWRAQTKTVDQYVNILVGLVIIMSVAAIFAIANSLFSMVAGRSREIAMLRTIGYRGGQILFGFVLESVILSLLGGVVGILGCAAYLALMGNRKDMFGANTFTAMAFQIHMSPMLIGLALTFVGMVGVVAALFPAWRAARTEVIAALRQA